LGNTINLAAQLQAGRLRKGPPCAISLICAELAEEDAASLQEAFADAEIPAAVIYRVLTGNGFSVSTNTVQRHRRGECSCEHR